MRTMFKKIDDVRKAKTFIYDHFEIEETENNIKITYFFEIPDLEHFEPTLEIPKSNFNTDKETIEELAFHVGLVELISYWKCACPKEVIIHCGHLEQEQIKWFKKLYFYGLGEFLYTNEITASEENLMNMITTGPKRNIKSTFNGEGNMIAIGGGKDSCVTLSLLEEEKKNACFIINPKKVMLECASAAGYREEQIIKIKRTISPNIIKLNQEGYFNGHTPFSAMVAFVSYLAAYLNNKKYIVLSNESSANESNVKGTKVNHQYSKSYEFEKDFTDYTKKYLPIDIHYFSLLRPLSEYQIGMLFSKDERFHKIFKSCNRGSKIEPWQWCGKCAKCLFVFSLLSPFLYKEKLVEIFGRDLFEDKELLKTFQELLGYGETKPFDCVGTYEEINYAITKTVSNEKGEKLPYLLEYYKEHYLLSDLTKPLETRFNKEHNLNEHFENILRKRLEHDRTDY